MLCRRHLVPALLALALAVVGTPVSVQASCSKDDFAAVVDQSGQILRTLNDANKAPFQGKLRQLKTKHGWTDQQFLVEARPYVIDEKIKAFDEEANGLVQQIGALGDTSGASVPDCTVLDGLKANLAKLVAVVTAKWQYMGTKIDAALK